MEDRDALTLRNRGILIWLAAVLLLGVVITVAAPPSFWLSAVGVACIATAGFCHSARTDQWNTWERWEPQMNWFEGWLACTGAALFLAPWVGFFFVR